MKSYKINAGELLFFLFIVFLVLKVSKTVTWSWWIVTLPIWGPLAALLCAGSVFLFIVAIIFAIGMVTNK